MGLCVGGPGTAPRKLQVTTGLKMPPGTLQTGEAEEGQAEGRSSGRRENRGGQQRV